MALPNILPRRWVLKGAIALPALVLAPAALPAATAPSVGPDPHPAWLAQWHDLRGCCNARGASDAQIEAAVDAMDVIEARMAATPAHTPAGAAAQIGMVLALRAVQRPLGDAGDELDVTLRRAMDALTAL